MILKIAVGAEPVYIGVRPPYDFLKENGSEIKEGALGSDPIKKIKFFRRL